MNQYAILMRETDNAWEKLPDEEQRRLLVLYNNWVGDLRARGIFKMGEPFGPGGRVLRMANGQVMEKPSVDYKETLTGFFIVEAADWDGASAIARTCPALTHGEMIEIRQIGHG